MGDVMWWLAVLPVALVFAVGVEWVQYWTSWRFGYPRPWGHTPRHRRR